MNTDEKKLPWKQFEFDNISHSNEHERSYLNDLKRETNNVSFNLLDHIRFFNNLRENNGNKGKEEETTSRNDQKKSILTISKEDVWFYASH